MMKANGRKYNLVKYEKPKGDYMVLESLSQEKNTSRIIHIIKPSRALASHQVKRSTCAGVLMTSAGTVAVMKLQLITSV